MSQPAPAGAIFLSYAREDGDAARRIADALRAFGMEVWFDQAELRGGDAWDQKIRRQIRDCTLFMPVISATTQERGEGYFRREWKLGVERTHDMAAGVPFIVPVTIDGIAAEEAGVPEEFLRYQWTHLRHGVPSAEFVEQVRRLLEAPRKAAGMGKAGGKPAAVAPQAPAGKSRARLAVGLALLVILLGALIPILSHRGSPVASAQAPSAPPTAGVAEAPPPAGAADKSVAVLPFENMSSGKDGDAFFADGIQEDILTKLSLVKALRVVSRTSVMQYRGTTKSLPQIARELGVAYILEGSVRRAGDKVRVTGQLIRAATDEHIWAQAYDRDLTDIFAIQGELAQAIADALQAELSPAEKTLLEHRPTDNPEAYDLYLRGRAARGNSESLARQETPLRAAVQLDPNFAAAWGELAVAEAFASFNDDDASPERQAMAKDAIDTAVRLAPDDPAVIEDLGDYHYYAHRDYDGAREQYLRLAELHPNDPSVHRSLGLIHRRKGEWREAVAELRRAEAADPGNANTANALLETLTYNNHFAEAKAAAVSLLARFPDSALMQSYAALIPFYATGSTEGAEPFRRKVLPPAAEEFKLYLLRIFAQMSGDFRESIEMYRQHPYLDISGETHWSQTATFAVALEEAGQSEAARAKAQQGLQEIAAEESRQAANAYVWDCKAACLEILGRGAEAVACADKAVALVPESLDRLQGPNISLARAAALAWAGRRDEALAEFGRLLKTPGGTNVHIWKRGFFPPISFKPLRGDPRFQALLDDPANNAPLY